MRSVRRVGMEVWMRMRMGMGRTVAMTVAAEILLGAAHLPAGIAALALLLLAALSPFLAELLALSFLLLLQLLPLAHELLHLTAEGGAVIGNIGGLVDRRSAGGGADLLLGLLDFGPGDYLLRVVEGVLKEIPGEGQLEVLEVVIVGQGADGGGRAGGGAGGDAGDGAGAGFVVAMAVRVGVFPVFAIAAAVLFALRGDPLLGILFLSRLRLRLGFGGRSFGRGLGLGK